MTSRLAAVLLVLAAPFTLLPSVRADDTADLPLGNDAWDLRQMDQDPVKLVKHSYDPDTKEARFIIEFQRDLTVRDIDWTGVRARPPYWFRFENADRVAITSVIPEYDSVLIGQRGRRVQFTLKLPDKKTMDQIKKVVVDHRPYGEER